MAPPGTATPPQLIWIATDAHSCVTSSRSTATVRKAPIVELRWSLFATEALHEVKGEGVYMKDGDTHVEVARDRIDRSVAAVTDESLPWCS